MYSYGEIIKAIISNSIKPSKRDSFCIKGFDKNHPFIKALAYELEKAGSGVSYEPDNFLFGEIERYREVDGERHIKRLLFDFPSKLMFERSGFSSVEDFCDYCYSVMLVDYTKIRNLALPLKEILDNGKEIQIIGKDTNLLLSVDTFNSVICAGEDNFPGGEIYMTPQSELTYGEIAFNTHAFYNGVEYGKIKLKFSDGMVCDAHAEMNDDKFEWLLAYTPGAHRLGEFAIGLNPAACIPIKNVLFDEKIFGSIHLALGSHVDTIWEDDEKGNKSKVHFDIVQLHRNQKDDYLVLVDDKPIMKNGIFISNDLQPLNQMVYRK